MAGDESGSEVTVMPVEQLQADQQALEPKDDLAPYAGKWVALRDGRVVSSDIDPTRLREQDGVEETDVIVPVSHAEGVYFVA